MCYMLLLFYYVYGVLRNPVCGMRIMRNRISEGSTEKHFAAASPITVTRKSIHPKPFSIH